MYGKVFSKVNNFYTEIFIAGYCIPFATTDWRLGNVYSDVGVGVGNTHPEIFEVSYNSHFTLQDYVFAFTVFCNRRQWAVGNRQQAVKQKNNERFHSMNFKQR